MRILTSSKVYRAFPELDRFEDERCERFVKAAKSSLWWNWGSKAGLLAVLGFVGAVSFGGFAVVVDRLEKSHRASQSDAAQVLALSGLLAVALAIPFFVMLMARDMNLRRRLRYILRARGTCMACHYSLVGLAVDERCMVTCPECGGATQVDESLGELVMDEAGRARFKPSEDALPEARMWPSAAARRTIKKWIKRTVIGVPIALVVGWGGYELLLQWQASVARRERPGPGGLLALIEKAQPADAPAGAPDAWEVFKDLSERVAALEARMYGAAPRTAMGKQVQLDASAIYTTPRGDDDEIKEAHALEVRFAREFLAAAKGEGLFDLMQEMASRKRAVRAIGFSPAQPAIMSMMPELGIARKLARINAARFEVAREGGEAAEMGRALEGSLALARMCSLQGTMIDGLVGVAIESLALERAKMALMNAPTREMVEAIEKAMDSQGPRAGIVHTLRGEQAYELDTICWAFGDPGNVRFGRFSPRLSSLGLGSNIAVPLGWYWQNRDGLESYYDQCVPQAAKAPHARTMWIGGTGMTNLLLLQTLVPAVTQSVSAADQAELMRRGVRTMVGLEKYRLEHGEYPVGLSALVPGYLEALPLDPWSGRSLGYQRINALYDAWGRGFSLYSAGGDSHDDGGTPCAENCLDAGRTAGGTDFIINRPGK